MSSARTRQWMLDAISTSCAKHQVELWAYVIMPEHVHLLLHPTQASYSISRILSSLKQPVAKRAIHYVHTHATSFLRRMTDEQPNGKCSIRFWQRGGGYDRNLWSPRHIWATIDYIHMNPVRRGLCATDTDWTWSTAKAYHGLQYLGPRVDVGCLPDDPRRINAV